MRNEPTPIIRRLIIGGRFFMKLTLKDKKEIYRKRKKGWTISKLSSQYNVRDDNIQYLIRLIDKHGFSVLRMDKNTMFSKHFKERAVARVLSGEASAQQVSIELGLRSKGTLHNWIKNYKENGYNIIERPRGRSAMTKKPKNNIPTEQLSAEEKLKQLEKENLYLRAENEYLKKLDVVVQKRKQRKCTKR